MHLLQDRSVRDLVLVHLIFAVIAAATLMIPATLTINVRLLIVVTAYNVLLPIVAHQQGHDDWKGIWVFCIMLSVLQIFPDWFLSAGLNVLTFIDQSAPMVGDVPLYMAGLWAIPLFIIIYAGHRVSEQRGRLGGYVAAGSLSLLIFGMAEATMWMLSSWDTLAQVVIGHVALYILLPEVILGMTALLAYDTVRNRGLIYKLVAAYLVMTLYMGNASLFYLVVEVLLI
jgi:hypothetical protein